MRPNGRFTFWSAWIVFSAAFLICRFSLFDPVFYNVDEAEYAVAAQALGEGARGRVRAVGHRPQRPVAVEERHRAGRVGDDDAHTVGQRGLAAVDGRRRHRGLVARDECEETQSEARAHRGEAYGSR